MELLQNFRELVPNGLSFIKIRLIYKKTKHFSYSWWNSNGTYLELVQKAMELNLNLVHPTTLLKPDFSSEFYKGWNFKRIFVPKISEL